MVLTSWRPVARLELEDDDAVDIAVEAAVYAYPMVLMEMTRRARITRQPMNRFDHARRFPDATFTEHVRPDVDTLASTLWFDVSREPLVIRVPDPRGRYYLLSILDMWTDVFASPGSRTSGAGAHAFAIVGPRWVGELPPGVEQVRAPTAVGWINGRVQVRGPTLE